MDTARVFVVDYGIGNLGSVTKGFRHAGAEVRLSGDPDVLRTADALILPGDGALAAQTVARRVHEFVRRRAWGELAPGLTVTVSVGVGPLEDC